MITTISFDEILPIWRNDLWPTRESAIETNSAMIMLGGYDMFNMATLPTFFACKQFGVIIGVNSGHMCNGNVYRSRGLFVYPPYRSRGIGKELLLATIQQATNEGASAIWSYPKFSSWKTYQSAGFSLASAWEESELDTNAYCIKSLTPNNH